MNRFIINLVIVCVALAVVEVTLVAHGHRWLAVGLTGWTIAIWLAGFEEGRRYQRPDRMEHPGRHRGPDHH